MIVVHLCVQGLVMSHWLSLTLTELTRFAAGGFVFVSGLGVGMIYLPKARDAVKRWGVYGSLWKRAGYVMGVHYAATLAFLVFYPLAGFGPYEDVWFQIRKVLLLQSGTDLLPFYAAMLFVCPFVLELLRRGAWPVVVGLSVVCFVWGTSDPYRLALPMGGATFIVPLWQIIFVSGMLFGAAKPAYERGPKKLMAGVSLCVAVFMTLAAYADYFGIRHLLPGLFSKTPVSWGEVLRYVSITLTLIIGTDVMWKHLSRTPVVSFVARIGRRSLSMYVLHVWVIGFLLLGVWQLELTSDIGAVMTICVGIGALWTLAWLMDAWPFAPVLRARMYQAWLRRVECPAPVKPAWSGSWRGVVSMLRMPATVLLAMGVLLFTDSLAEPRNARTATNDIEQFAPDEPASPLEVLEEADIIPS